jgi:hypothetical protein
MVGMPATRAHRTRLRPRLLKRASVDFAPVFASKGGTALAIAILTIVLVLPAAMPLIIHWYQCERLAPIERSITRGC